MEELIKRIEKLREGLNKLADSEDKELRLKISEELDEAIVEYIKLKDSTSKK